MELNSEDISNRESYQKFGQNDPTDDKTNNSKCFQINIKLLIIIILIIILIATIIAIIILLVFTDKDELICDKGYFLPEDDPSQCIKCSVEKCIECHGTKLSDICTSCKLGYLLEKSICIENYSIKANYYSESENELINLIHFMFVPHMIEMIVDDIKVEPCNEYTFNKNGNHTIYYLLDNDYESLGEMFYGVNKLISIVFTHLFNMENITNLNFMFYGCTQLTNIDLSYFNTKNVINMSGMFELCRSLTSLNLSAFNTQNVTSMNMMFYGCSSLKSIDISHFNTKYLTGMNSMFESCYNLTEINICNFNTKYVTSFSYLFHRCYSLTSIDLSNFSIEKVGFMEGMFEDCYSLTSINISHFNTENVTKIDYMFYGCSKLEYIDISGFTFDKNVSLFYDLPDYGTLITNSEFINKVDRQIPTNWNIILK